jgi:EXLDI family protein
VHRQLQPDWGGVSDPAWWFDVENWKGLDPRRRDSRAEAWYRSGEASLTVCDDLGQLEASIPPELFAQLAQGWDAPPIEDLDI